MKCILNTSKNLNIQTSEKHHFQIFAIIAVDSIWFLRNKIIHEALNPNIENFVNDTLKIYKEHCEAWGNEQINKSHKVNPIPKDHNLLTFNVVVRSSGSTTATICRLEEGTPIFVQTRQIKS